MATGPFANQVETKQGIVSLLLIYRAYIGLSPGFPLLVLCQYDSNLIDVGAAEILGMGLYAHRTASINSF